MEVVLASYQGLTEEEIVIRRQKFGKNALKTNKFRRVFEVIKGIVTEPMFGILILACLLYFLLGEWMEGWMMLIAVMIVSAISFWQEVKSNNALSALQKLTEPKVRVIRDRKQKWILTEDLVPGDLVLLSEGEKVPADVILVQQHDLSVDESMLTGESMPVEKELRADMDQLFQGTLINTGQCYAQVTATGHNTVLGKLGRSILDYTTPKTLLEHALQRLVRQLSIFGFAAFLIIFWMNFRQTGQWIPSLLYGLTLAMSAIPEELPVAFSSFMALGAFKMSQLGIITRKPATVENLGAVGVICLDKTGTITENKMSVERIYDSRKQRTYKKDQWKDSGSSVLLYGWLASESNPFDMMEKAIEEAAVLQTGYNFRDEFKIIKEYPLGGTPPMMTHVYEREGLHLATAKGAVERIIRVCQLGNQQAADILKYSEEIAEGGKRVIGVASASHKGTFPENQDDFHWEFEGLIGLYDPPKAGIKDILQQFYTAGIQLKMITGDFPQTALSIASEIGLHSGKVFMTGEEVLRLSPETLQKKVDSVQVFARMLPEAKLKVIEALKQNGHIVAMTGDGINDGPALKAADIGVALGKKGTEVARRSADLILTNDDLKLVIEAIRQGRKSYSNFVKAVRYIISIHIPIILTASLPVLLGWRYPNIFTPVHIIFLELMMGPTCSIFYEREPVEPSIMKEAPRKKKTALLTTREIVTSIIQGLIITSGTLVEYKYFMEHSYSLNYTRTMVFLTLILSNLLLTFVNRSFSHTLFVTITYTNKLVLPVLTLSGIFLYFLLGNAVGRKLFGLEAVSMSHILWALLTAMACVLWFELYKGFVLLIRNKPLYNIDHSHNLT